MTAQTQTHAAAEERFSAKLFVLVVAGTIVFLAATGLLMSWAP